MELTDKNKTIAAFLGFRMMQYENGRFSLQVPQDKITNWQCGYNIFDEIPMFAESEEDAWKMHCPHFFFDDAGLRVLTDWLYENGYCIVHTAGDKLGVRKPGKLDEGVYVSKKVVYKEFEECGVFSLSKNLFQPCIATAVLVLALRYNATKKAKAASGVTPAE